MKDIKYQQSFQSLNDYRQQIREIVQGRMKSAVLDMVCQLFEDELHFLCGPRYDRKAECSRAGSDPGSIYVNGQRVLIKNPRVKKKGKEVSVKTYSALRDYDLGAGAVGSFGGLATSNYDRHFQAKTVILSSALGGLIGMGVASVIYEQSKNNEAKRKTVPTYEKMMIDPMMKNKPDLIKPRIETRWVEGRIVGDKYIEGHFEYIIVEPTHWGQ